MRFTTTLLFSLALILTSTFAHSQPDNWNIYHNKKLLLTATDENETKNILSLKRSELDKIGELIVVYEEGNPDKEWKRTIAIVDENSNSLFEKTEINKIQVSNADLKKLAEGKTTLKIYTWALPKDPAKAALIRIRRVHLCTLELK